MSETNLIEKLEEMSQEDMIDSLMSTCEPVHVISGSGWGWFLDPESSTMSRIMRGTEIIPIDSNVDASDRILVESPFGLLMIPEDEVSEIGWN